MLYTGVTSNLERRVTQHKNKFRKKAFTAQYNCNKLVYFCGFPNIAAAIAEEKRIKAGRRKKKIELMPNGSEKNTMQEAYNKGLHLKEDYNTYYDKCLKKGGVSE